jgi:hypothetical protein
MLHTVLPYDSYKVITNISEKPLEIIFIILCAVNEFHSWAYIKLL